MNNSNPTKPSLKTMNAATAARILAAIGNGPEVRDAIDGALGAGTYERMVRDDIDRVLGAGTYERVMRALYDELREV